MEVNMEISRKELKLNAKQIMQNKSQLIIITLIYTIVSSIVSFIGSFLEMIPFVGFFISLGISLATFVFSLQINKINMDATNNEPIDIFDFSNLKKAIFVSLWSLLYMIPSIIAYIVGIAMFISQLTIKPDDMFFHTEAPNSFQLFGLAIIFIGVLYNVYISYALSFSIFMVYDGRNYENKSAYEIVKLCLNLTKGNKLKLFILDLSFIGWFMLMGLIILIPIIGWLAIPVVSTLLSVYIVLTKIQFYKTIASVEINEQDNNILNMNKE
jgi:uncharacterized membrane protein